MGTEHYVEMFCRYYQIKIKIQSKRDFKDSFPVIPPLLLGITSLIYFPPKAPKRQE